MKNNDVIELVHVKTEKLLNSHDVAAPLSPANQEIAGYINYSAKFIPYLQWKIVCDAVLFIIVIIPLGIARCQG